jgi:hypothetical protein
VTPPGPTPGRGPRRVSHPLTEILARSCERNDRRRPKPLARQQRAGEHARALWRCLLPSSVIFPSALLRHPGGPRTDGRHVDRGRPQLVGQFLVIAAAMTVTVTVLASSSSRVATSPAGWLPARALYRHPEGRADLLPDAGHALDVQAAANYIAKDTTKTRPTPACPPSGYGT